MATPKKKQQEIPTPQVEARIDRLVDGDFKTKAYASATIGGALPSTHPDHRVGQGPFHLHAPGLLQEKR